MTELWIYGLFVVFFFFKVKKFNMILKSKCERPKVTSECEKCVCIRYSWERDTVPCVVTKKINLDFLLLCGFF